MTGSLKAAFTSAIVSFASPGGGSFGSILASAAIGGLASKAQGGNFGHGFWSAGLGAALGGRIKTGNAYANVAISAVIGGTVSKLTGGKFANGAQTWAFSAAMAQDWEFNAIDRDESADLFDGKVKVQGPASASDLREIRDSSESWHMKRVMLSLIIVILLTLHSLTK